MPQTAVTSKSPVALNKSLLFTHSSGLLQQQNCTWLMRDLFWSSFSALSMNNHKLHYRNVYTFWSFTAAPCPIRDVINISHVHITFLHSEHLISKHTWPQAFQRAAPKVHFIACSLDHPGEWPWYTVYAARCISTVEYQNCHTLY